MYRVSAEKHTPAGPGRRTSGIWRPRLPAHRQRDDKADADRKKAVAREQAKKDHAKRALYGHKKRNADLKLDDGSTAMTLEEYTALDALVDAADSDDGDDEDDEDD